MERHPGQEEKHVWRMVGSGRAARRLGDEIRGLDWFGKSWEGQATSVGFILWLWPGRGAGWRSGHRKTGGMLLQPGPCKGTAEVKGRGLRGAASWRVHEFCKRR